MPEEKNPQDEQKDSANSADSRKHRAGKNRPKRRVLKAAILLLMMIAAAVAAAPEIIARTSLRNSPDPEVRTRI